MPKAAMSQWPVGLMCRARARWTDSCKHGLIFKERWNQSRPSPFQLCELKMYERQVHVCTECMPVSVEAFIVIGARLTGIRWDKGEHHKFLTATNR